MGRHEKIFHLRDGLSKYSPNHAVWCLWEADATKRIYMAFESFCAEQAEEMCVRCDKAKEAAEDAAWHNSHHPSFYAAEAAAFKLGGEDCVRVVQAAQMEKMYDMVSRYLIEARQ